MIDRVLVVDDDADQCALLEAMLTRMGYVVDTSTTAAEARRCASEVRYSAILTDLEMAETSGIDLCAELLAERPGVPIILVTGHQSVDTVAAAIRAGAYDYLTKPVEPKQLGLRVARASRHAQLVAEVGRLRGALREGDGTASILGKSSSMRELNSLIARVAETSASVLIHGETGTGKELVARAIHQGSERAKGRFVAINCAAVPASLLESELFGHAKGAFTDAKGSREGLFVQASGGTLLLDEIGEMPLDMQTKLLRALQERTVRPVGSNTEIPFDTRVVAATHRNLDEEVKAKRFRQDLFYRINVVRIDVPPLRERRDDVLELAAHFLDKFAARIGRSRMELSTQVAQRLVSYEWPGNVRELENCMERLVALGRFDQTMPEDLPDHIRASTSEGALDVDDGVITLDELERQHISRVLKHVGGNKSRAAELLGLDRRTLYRKLSSYAQDEGGMEEAGNMESAAPSEGPEGADGAQREPDGPP